jgi:hypothetical protein
MLWVPLDFGELSILDVGDHTAPPVATGTRRPGCRTNRFSVMVPHKSFLTPFRNTLRKDATIRNIFFERMDTSSVIALQPIVFTSEFFISAGTDLQNDIMAGFKKAEYPLRKRMQCKHGSDRHVPIGPEFVRLKVARPLHPPQ